MLVATRSSQDFACCARETSSARTKYASALVQIDKFKTWDHLQNFSSGLLL
jgi:hypothetical protein